MKPIHTIIVAAFVGFCAAFIGVQTFAPQNTSSQPQKESVYERVMRTGKVRCGYSLWKPLLWINTDTQEVTGIFHDLMFEVGQRLNLEIEWTAELGWGDVVQSVNSGHVDMACAGYWLHPSRISHVQSTEPLFYAPLHIWVKGDDTRKFNNINQLNSPEYTVVLIDGGSSDAILDKWLPKTNRLSLPQMATNGDVVESILTRKADFFIDDVTSFHEYNQKNPNSLKVLFKDKPLAVFPATMLLPREQNHLKTMIDNTLRLVELDGTLDKILKKYRVSESFLRNSEPSFVVN